MIDLVDGSAHKVFGTQTTAAAGTLRAILSALNKKIKVKNGCRIIKRFEEKRNDVFCKQDQV